MSPLSPAAMVLVFVSFCEGHIVTLISHFAFARIPCVRKLDLIAVLTDLLPRRCRDSQHNLLYDLVFFFQIQIREHSEGLGLVCKISQQAPELSFS